MQLFDEVRGFESFQDFCIERKRSLDKLKTDEECPGEDFCTNDPLGICFNRDLDEHCHGKEDGCHLFYTKQGSTPFEYEALLDAGLRLKERTLNNLDINESETAYFEIISLTYFGRAERIVDNEPKDEVEDTQKQGMPGRGFVKGDSSAFNWSDEQLAEMYQQQQNKRKQRMAAKKQ